MPIEARFALVFAVALVAGLLLARLAPALGLLDHPGGRKDHADATPLVGGLAIFCAMLVAGAIGNMGEAYRVMLAAGGVLVLTGIIDDRHEIGPLPRYVLQAVAALVMAYGANVVLHGQVHRRTNREDHDQDARLVEWWRGQCAGADVQGELSRSSQQQGGRYHQ